MGNFSSVKMQTTHAHEVQLVVVDEFGASDMAHASDVEPEPSFVQQQKFALAAPFTALPPPARIHLAPRVENLTTLLS